MDIKFHAGSFPVFAIFWRIWIAAIICSIFSGCATVDRWKPANEVVFAPKHGVAVLELTSNGISSELFPKWERLIIKDTATGAEHIAFDGLRWRSNRSLFVIALPEGDYILDKLENFENTQIGTNLTSKAWSSAKLGRGIGKFRIQAGKVTNLGMMAFVRRNLGDDRQYLVDFLPAKPEFDRTLDLLDPNVAAVAKGGTLNWTTETETEQAPLKRGMAYGRSFYLNAPDHAKDGSVYFGEAFGQIARRDPSGKWTWLQTRGASPILSVSVFDDGSILAGSEQGFLFFKRAKEEKWRTIPFPRKDVFVRFVGALPGIGFVAVAHDKGNVFVMSTPDLEAPTWSELSRMPLEVNTPPMYSPFKTWINGSRMTIATVEPTGFSRKLMFYEFDAKSKVWRTIPVTQGFHDFGVSPSGSLYGLSAALGFQSASASNDGGFTWEKRASPNWLTSPAFRNADVGFAIHWDSAVSGERTIWATTDGGNRWAKLNNAPKHSTWLVLLDSPSEMLVVTSNNELYFTRNSGATWTMERSM